MATRERLGYLTDRLVDGLRFDRDLSLHAEAEDPFLDVEHPELGHTFTYVGAKWLAPDVPWVQGHGRR